MNNAGSFTPAAERAAVDLDNCAREPIHIPGRIQSHGALLVFDGARTLTHRSANLGELLGPQAPALGQTLDSGMLASHHEVMELIEECFRSDGVDVEPFALEASLNQLQFEIIGHRLGAQVVVEMEQQGEAAAGVLPDDAFRGHRALNRLKRQRSVDGLLTTAVEEVQRMTGFDRVMAYRFQHDDSGEVVAEVRVPTLEPFLGRRYPASDIPAQARRLYTLNTLRIIVDVAAPTVPIEALAPEAAPLDMSHCVLRGVSPVHIEYLGNMGVAASMSISIVINGVLWGMLACHHMRPLHVPYRVREACDVLAHVLAVNAQNLTAQANAHRIEAAASVRARAIEGLLYADEGIFALLAHAPAVCEMFESQALVLAERGRVAVWGDIPAGVARQLVQWLEASQRPAVSSAHALTRVPAELRPALGVWCGFLALRFNESTQGCLVLLRKEQIETIAWGGKAEKHYAHGPLGPRLTPRGSFDVWKETVRGQSVPWSDTDLEIAQAMLGELLRASYSRGVELDQARGHLLEMLRDGVRVDAARASASTATSTPASAAAAALYAVSGTRMERLVAQVLDASRIASGVGLELRLEPVNLSQLVHEMVDELRRGDASLRFILELPKVLSLHGDVPRLRQMLGCLLTNAIAHGAVDEGVLVQMHPQERHALLEISNVAQEIAPDQVDAMFEPLRQASTASGRTVQDGLGLGVYIARHIAEAHGGELSYSYADPYVTFTVTLALAGQGAG